MNRSQRLNTSRRGSVLESRLKLVMNANKNTLDHDSIEEDKAIKPTTKM